MSKLKTCIWWTLWIQFCIILGALWFLSIEKMQAENRCNCNVNYGGHNMSVEDAFERAGEGLTVDQTDEVQVLIEEYCK